jgi:cobalt-zinc-cadmium efflux system outer membrane protein
VKTYTVISILTLAAARLAAQPAAAPPDQVTIEQAVQEAVGHNLNLLAERYNLSIADARIITAKLRPNPVFSAGVDYVDFKSFQRR